MKHCLSYGHGDPYVAYDSETRKVVSPAIITVLGADRESAEFLRMMGFVNEAMNLEHELDRIEQMKPEKEE